jgi:hypothetical protein
MWYNPVCGCVFIGDYQSWPGMWVSRKVSCSCMGYCRGCPAATPFSSPKNMEGGNVAGSHVGFTAIPVSCETLPHN